jgi:hypothetical protein
MKRVVIILVSTVLGVLVFCYFYFALELGLREKDMASDKEVTMTAKMEPMVEKLEELSLFPPKESVGDAAMKESRFPRAGAYLFRPQEAVGGLLIETPIKEETKFTVSEEKREVVAIIEKNFLPEEAPSKRKMLPVEAFTINVASFREKKNANRYVDELKEKSLDAFAWDVNLSKEERWHRVSVGSFSSRQKAENYREKLIQTGISNTWITEIPESF